MTMIYIFYIKRFGSRKFHQPEDNMAVMPKVTNKMYNRIAGMSMFLGTQVATMLNLKYPVFSDGCSLISWQVGRVRPWDGQLTCFPSSASNPKLCSLLLVQFASSQVLYSPWVVFVILFSWHLCLSLCANKQRLVCPIHSAMLLITCSYCQNLKFYYSCSLQPPVINNLHDLEKNQSTR